MRSLREAVAALKAEIEQGLTMRQAGTAEMLLAPERVVVNLTFEAHADTQTGEGVGFYVAAQSNNAAPRQLSSVTIEFRIQSASNNPPEATAISASPISSVLEGETADRVQEQLASIFGTPGFDSSARATVFREALENLSPSDVQTLTGILLGKSTIQPGAPIVHSVSLLDRVMKSGPAGIAQGRRALAEILQQHDVSQVLDLVAHVWKSQEGWID